MRAGRNQLNRKLSHGQRMETSVQLFCGKVRSVSVSLCSPVWVWLFSRRSVWVGEGSGLSRSLARSFGERTMVGRSNGLVLLSLSPSSQHLRGDSVRFFLGSGVNTEGARQAGLLTSFMPPCRQIRVVRPTHGRPYVPTLIEMVDLVKIGALAFVGSLLTKRGRCALSFVVCQLPTRPPSPLSPPRSLHPLSAVSLVLPFAPLQFVSLSFSPFHIPRPSGPDPAAQEAHAVLAQDASWWRVVNERRDFKTKPKRDTASLHYELRRNRSTLETPFAV